MDALRSIVFLFFFFFFFFSLLSVRASVRDDREREETGEDWKKSMEMDYIMKEREVDEF